MTIGRISATTLLEITLIIVSSGGMIALIEGIGIEIVIVKGC